MQNNLTAYTTVWRFLFFHNELKESTTTNKFQYLPFIIYNLGRTFLAPRISHVEITKGIVNAGSP